MSGDNTRILKVYFEAEILKDLIILRLWRLLPYAYKKMFGVTLSRESK